MQITDSVEIGYVEAFVSEIIFGDLFIFSGASTTLTPQVMATAARTKHGFLGNLCDKK